MAFFNKYPYTDYNDFNLDWVIKTVKEAVAQWTQYRADMDQWKTDTQAAFDDLYNYVHDYFDNLDLTDEVRRQIDRLVNNGTIKRLLAEVVGDWQQQLNVMKARLDNIEAGTTPEGSEVTDIRVTYLGDTLGSAGAAVRGQAKTIANAGALLHSQILENLPNINAFDGRYLPGYYANQTGIYDDSNRTYVCNASPIYIPAGCRFVWNENARALPSLGIGYLFYQGDGTFISSTGIQQTNAQLVTPIPDGAVYFNFDIRFNANTSPETAPLIRITFDFELNGKQSLQASDYINDDMQMIWTHFQYVVGDGSRTYNANRLCMRYAVTAPCDLVIDTYPMYATILEFNRPGDVSNTDGFLNRGVARYPRRITKGTNFIINLRDDNAAVPDDGYKNVRIYRATPHDMTGARWFGPDGYNDLALSQPFGFTAALTYRQSFCIHDNKIYSYDNGNLAVQNAEDMSVVNTVPVDMGHGNSMQLNSDTAPTHAWVSGWDDNKIYKLNLETLAVDDTIDLTGVNTKTGVDWFTADSRTTCAVDEVTELAYVFMRQAPVTHAGAYEFFKIDLRDMTILQHTRTAAFGAQQALDYYNGMLFVLAGLPSANTPNKYMVFNTNGDIIGQWFVPAQESKEPEGICWDRDTGYMYMSYADRFIWTVNKVIS